MGLCLAHLGAVEFAHVASRSAVGRTPASHRRRRPPPPVEQERSDLQGAGGLEDQRKASRPISALPCLLALEASENCPAARPRRRRLARSRLLGTTQSVHQAVTLRGDALARSPRTSSAACCLEPRRRRGFFFSPGCRRLWAESAVAARLPAGLPWRLGYYLPAAARPPPCGIGRPALRGL